MHLRTLILAACSALALLSLSFAHAEEVTFASAPLFIVTQDKTLRFSVEVAADEAQREHGLMFRKNIPDKSGMIFDFGKPQHIDMWMKNTPASLDMIFISDRGVITQIAAHTVPESTAIIASGADACAVLEVAGGTAEHYHIARGDKVLYSIFP